MASLRGSRAFSDLQVTGLQFQRGAIPAGATEGYPLGVSLDGKVAAVRNLAADSLAVENVVISGGLTTNTLQVRNGMGLSGYSQFDGNMLIRGNLGVTGWITSIHPLIPAEGCTSYQGLHFLAGACPAPMDGDYSLDVIGASRFNGPIDISGGVTLQGTVDISGGLNMLDSGYIQFVDTAGVTTGYVNATAAGLYLQSPQAVRFGTVNQASPTMTLTMGTKTLEFTGGKIETASIVNAAGTLTLGDPVQVTPVLLNGPVTVTNGIAMGAGTTLSLRGSIVNPTSNPVRVADGLRVDDGLIVGKGITCSTGLVRALGGLVTTTLLASQSATFNSNVAVNGTLTTTQISGNGATVQVSPSLSVSGMVSAGILNFSASSSSLIQTAESQLTMSVVGANGNIRITSSGGGGPMYLTPNSSASNSISSGDSTITVTSGIGGLYIGPQNGIGGLRVGGSGSVDSYGSFTTSGDATVFGNLTVDDSQTIQGQWERSGRGVVYPSGITGISYNGVNSNSIIIATAVGVTGYTVAVDPQIDGFFIRVGPAPPMGGISVNWMVARL